ncbi:hypothetical protein EMCRGX_G019187 [Ephydatia muelleri]
MNGPNIRHTAVRNQSTHREELRGVAHAFTPDVTAKIYHILHENERAGRVLWHGGAIPSDEIWIKVCGDKDGGAFKMAFQIINTPNPNAVHSTCVFSCFEAKDSTTNLHIALDRFDKMASLHWKDYKLRIFLTGDYEFLCKMCGLSGASGKCPCPFCLITNDGLQSLLSKRKPKRKTWAPRSLQLLQKDNERWQEGI